MESGSDAIAEIDDILNSLTIDDSDRVNLLKNRGSELQRKFDETGSIDALNAAIKAREEAARFASAADRGECFYRLGISLGKRFDVTGSLEDLNASVEAREESVKFTPHGQPNRAACLYNFGFSLHRRFELTGSLDDLNASIAAKREAVELISGDHPLRGAFQFNLALSLQKRYEKTKSMSDLNSSIGSNAEALKLTLDDDPERIDRLHSFADSLIFRYEETGSIDDFETAFNTLKTLVSLSTSKNHPNRGAYVTKLNELFDHRANKATKVNDWDAGIKAYEEALTWSSDENRRAQVLTWLGVALRFRFESRGNIDDLNRSIEVGKQAVKVSQDNRAQSLIALGVTMFTRHSRLNSMDSLNEAIDAFQTAANLSADGQTRATYLINIGIMLAVRFKRTNSMDDINAAIKADEEAVKLAPSRLLCYSQLGFHLGLRFENTQTADDLDSGIRVTEEGLKLASESHNQAEMSSLLRNHGYLLRLRFEERADINDLNASIQVCKESIALSQNNFDKAYAMRQLGSALQLLFEHRGSLEDLNAAIDAKKSVLELIPADDKMHNNDLSQLGLSLLSRYKVSEEISDLDSAVRVQMESVQGDPNNPTRAIWLSNLGITLHARFRRTGSKVDLNSTIDAFTEASEYRLPGRQGIPSNLANALRTRFQLIGSMDDLNAAVVWGTKAVELTPKGHSDRPMYLSSLSSTYTERFSRGGDRNDLDLGVKLLEEAVESLPREHADRAKYLSNFGSALKSLFIQTGSLDDLDKSIVILQESASLSIGHPSTRAHCLETLAVSLMSRFKRTKDVDDLNPAIIAMEESVELMTRTNSPDRATSLFNLGATSELRYKSFLSDEDYEKTIGAYEKCVLVSTAGPSIRIKGARSAAKLIRSEDIERASRLLNVAVELLPSVSSRSLSWSDQEYALSLFNGLASDATAFALHSSLTPAETVRLLDSGRCIIYGHLLDTRSQLKGLPEDLAERYANLQNLLDPPYQSRASNGNNFQSTKGLHKAALDFEALEEEIRRIDEFRYFGRALPEAELLKQAARGPIVVLNVNPLRCDAFIVKESGILTHPLPKLRFEELEKQAEKFRISIEEITRSSHENHAESEHEQNLFQVLEWLWDSVAEEILVELGYMEMPAEGDKWPQLWWYLTGVISFLPIHAAGYHNDVSHPHRTVMDRVISAYTSSIRALTFSRANSESSNGKVHKPLIVAMPTTPNRPRLPLARDEAARIRQITWNQPGFDKPVVQVRPTTQELCDALPGNSIVHFVCHAEAAELNPSNSALMLKDGSVTVAQIAEMKLQGGALAYLSACRTALSRATQLDDEVITLTNAFQIAGFSGVVGTLWNAVDHVAFEVAISFYERLRGDIGNAAEALHFAVYKQRKNRRNKPSWWASYIYTGT